MKASGGGPAARHPKFSDFVDRFELFWKGIELGAIANQQSNVSDWRGRYLTNVQMKEKLGISPNAVNEFLLSDLDSLPSSYTGFGVGLDRITMLAARLNEISLVKFNWQR